MKPSPTWIIVSSSIYGALIAVLVNVITPHLSPQHEWLIYPIAVIVGAVFALITVLLYSLTQKSRAARDNPEHSDPTRK